MNLSELLEILRVLNASQSFTELHEKLIESVLKQIKELLEK